MKRNPPQALPENSVTLNSAQAEDTTARALATANRETLLRYPNGDFSLRTTQDQYFDGKSWRPYTAIAFEAFGITVDSNDPRYREREIEKPLTPDQARRWLIDKLLPTEVAPWFAAPLAGKGNALPAVKRAADAVGITSDQFICHAVQTYIDFVDAFPDDGAHLALFAPENVQWLQGRKWKQTEPARALFSRLYAEAVAAPFQTSMEKLRALRDLISPHPGFAYECDSISEIIASSQCLADAVGVINIPKAAA